LITHLVEHKKIAPKDIARIREALDKYPDSKKAKQKSSSKTKGKKS